MTELANALKAEQRLVDTLKGVNMTVKAQVIAHLKYKLDKEISRALTQSDTVRIHRAQGAAAVLSELSALFNPQDGP